MQTVGWVMDQAQPARRLKIYCIRAPVVHLVLEAEGQECGWLALDADGLRYLHGLVAEAIALLETRVEEGL